MLSKMVLDKTLGAIVSFIKTDKQFLIQYENEELATLHILNSHVFKYYMSPTGNFQDYPTPNNVNDNAKINVKKISDYDTTPFKYSVLEETDKSYNVYTTKITMRFDKELGTMTIHDRRTNKVVLQEAEPLRYSDKMCKQTLHQKTNEYFFGGGMQNGRFSHKGEKIEIVNSNCWTDGGVTSPCPFYWSSNGYGVLRNTWQPGTYDCGKKSIDIVETTHKCEDFDAFYFINSNPKDILNDYYELTGQPIFMPEYALYEAHLNAFNRDYWVQVEQETKGAILFEDGCYYKCYQPKDMHDKVGILESLNGEKNNYQFSARAMIDRYKKHDMPLGWFIPNDGYGCGYGQTDSLDGDIENLRSFAKYARKNGVECALWTESNVEPADPEHPKKGERDLRKEVGVAGVVALKCDVAWIGCGYSYGLSAVEHVAEIVQRQVNHKQRTMIIMVDGWAGTQRHAGIWSGDQYGGQWEYIRFHIPTYIGSGLSGIPIVGSDMDGIFGGGVKEVTIRDYQWKTFTPLQLNMDGWGSKQKTPFAYDDEANLVIRAYLKLKGMLMPYNYTISHESIHGLPMVRAMFLEFPKENCGYTKDSQYQYMWGPYILVAPVYKDQEEDKNEWVRHGIYLPNVDQVWVDLMTGEKYQGGKIWNYLKTPLWKIPVFVKDGAIIPMTNPNNNPNEIKRDERIFTIYPNGESNFEVYEDDGISAEYLTKQYATTKIEVIGPKSNDSGNVHIHVHKTMGKYKSMVHKRTTILKVMTTKQVEHIKASINDKSTTITKVDTEEEFNAIEDTYYYNPNYIVNPYLSKVGGEIMKQGCLMIKICNTDVTQNDIHIKLKDFENNRKIFGNNTKCTSLPIPHNFTVLDEEITPTDITLRWKPLKDVYYEIDRDGTIFTNITDYNFTFEGFQFNSEHKFRIRSANDGGVSKWSYYIVVSTKEDPLNHTVKDVKVQCNIGCEQSQGVHNLIYDDPTIWHTDWSKPGEADQSKGKEITLNFDLGDIYTIEKIEYLPRDDAGNGTILELQYAYSLDGNNWSPLSDIIEWEWNESVKLIELHEAEMRHVKINILNAVGGFGSGRRMRFYQKIN